MSARPPSMPGAVIVRLPNWLGDTVMAVPALRALRAHWPEARLILAGPWASLLVGQGVGDVLVDYPRRWSERLRAADSVRSLRGEVAVLLPNSLEAALAARYWGARRRVGFAGGRAWLLTDRIAAPVPRRHQVDEYLMVAEHLGCGVAERVPRLSPPDPDGPERREARALLGAGVSPGAGGARVGIHLGAEYGPAKRWPADRIAEACRLLARDGRTPVLMGPPADGPVAEAVARDSPALNLVGRDRPGLLTAMLAELDALVCGDTGVGHLAAAVGTPAIVLFGPTAPELTAPRGDASAVRNPVPCAPCFYRRCPIEHPCLRGIDAPTVLDRVDRALATRGA